MNAKVHAPQVQTPTATLARAAAAETAQATDAKGRIITVGRLNALQYYRLTKALGAAANNRATMELAVLVAHVRKIDQLDVAIPASERDVEFLMQQLDFDGLAAAGEAMEHLGESNSAEDKDEVAKN